MYYNVIMKCDEIKTNCETAAQALFEGQTGHQADIIQMHYVVTQICDKKAQTN